MAKMKLSLNIEDIVNKANKGLQNVARGVVQDAIPRGLDQIGQGVVSGALNLLKPKIGPVQQQAAYPIASMEDGYLLNNDNTLTPGPRIQQLNILKKNLFDQTAFTPEAQQYLNNIPLYSLNDMGKNALGVTYTERAPASNAPVNYRDIGINPRVFDTSSRMPKYMPAEVMTHEFLHAMDKNISHGPDATGNPLPPNANGSQGFYKTLTQKPSDLRTNINGFLQGYNPSQAFTRDTEGYAQTGAVLGNNALNSSVGNFYDQVFAPVEKTMNYSPVCA